MNQASNIVSIPISFLRVNTPGQVHFISEDSQSHECFLHLLSKESLDALIAKTNLLVGKALLKGHLGSCYQLKTYQS